MKTIREQHPQTDRINLHDPVTAICELLGLTPHHVRELQITPHTVTASVFKLNTDGAHHLDETGKVAVDTVVFKVTT